MTTRPAYSRRHLGSKSVREMNRLEALVRYGKASWWHPYRTVEMACDKAGIP